jgi:hypothetical protein
MHDVTSEISRRTFVTASRHSLSANQVPSKFWYEDSL